jgi:aldose 1-epimerase
MRVHHSAIACALTLGLTLGGLAWGDRAVAAGIEQEPFGQADGKEVSLFTLTNANGLIAKITNYGGKVTELHTPDRDGELADIVLGFDDLEGYLKGHPYFGAMVGRVGNRIANARFELEGQTYELAANNGPNHLHGGIKGFDKVVWDAEPMETDNGPALRLHYLSPDGEEGYPGNLDATVVYTLTNDDELRLDITATTDKATPVNIVHHSYWNLGGLSGGTILEHELQLFASKYTPGGPDLVPTGEVVEVAGTPFDFTTAKPIGQDLEKAGGDPVGYDGNFVVDGDPNELRPVARVEHPGSGRVMEISSNQPGVQFYTGNFMDGSESGKGMAHEQYTGFCLETQIFPDSINKEQWREAAILQPGETYEHVMIHKFSTE